VSAPLVDAFGAFAGSVPLTAVELPSGPSSVWDTGGGGRAMVLLHGIAGGRRPFFRVVPLLAGRRRVLVPLLRGEERPLRRAASYAEPCDDLAALLDALRLDDVTICGTSFGGAVALAYGCRNDPRVRDIVVQGTFARFRLRRLDRAVLHASRLVPASLGARYFASRVRRGAENRLLAERAPGLERLMPEWSARTPFATLRARTLLIQRADLAPDLARIDVPLTLAHGDKDKVVPRAYLERLCALRPDARHVVLEGVGHLAALTHPERFVALFE
jgi:pimeloyl-ACP methyl ester carboxylesterase